MRTLSVDNYRLCFTDGLDIIEAEPQSHDFEFHNGEMFRKFIVDGHDVMTCYEKKGGLFLHHLDVPEQGRGLGKLGLAVFYVVCRVQEYDSFCIKFGGGEQSKQFLEHLGFAEEQTAVVQDADYGQPSVVFGDVETVEERTHGWALNHVSLTDFPTSFFTLQ